MKVDTTKMPSQLLARFISLLLVVLATASCTTYKTQLGREATSFYTNHSLDTIALAYSVFVVGNPAHSTTEKTMPWVDHFKKRLEGASPKSSLLIVGQSDFGHQNSESYPTWIEKFKGRVFFLAGKKQTNQKPNELVAPRKLTESGINKKGQWVPQNGCGIESIALTEKIDLVALNSEWYLKDWDSDANINKGCAIKTRDQFLEALDEHLQQNPHKTILLATHHPLMSGGSYGGHFSIEQHLFPFEKTIPLPLMGSLYNLIRKASGFQSYDLQHVAYKEMNIRLKTLLQKYHNVVLVSGHEQNLQYLNKDGIQQIISGAGGSFTPARAINPKDFSYGGNGYAQVDVYANGASTVSFYSTPDQKEVLLFKQKLKEPESEEEYRKYAKTFPTEIHQSIFGRSVSRKSDGYQLFWGKHYKRYYKQPISGKVATLDTLFGGLQPLGVDTEQATKSLLLTDKNNREFVMTSLEKDAASFFKSVIYKNNSFKNQANNAGSEDFLRDYFTTIHPFIPLVIPTLSNAIQVNAIAPSLYFIPHHNQLGRFNADFGDQFYYIAPKANWNPKNLPEVGKPSAIVDTDDMLYQLRTNKNHTVDIKNYIRARLFDMLIGDWDRQAKNWRWAVFEEKNKVIYRPIPLNRDQAFAKYDGVFLKLLKAIPAMGQMHSYTYNPQHPRRSNKLAYALDAALLASVDEQLWVEQAQFVQKHLSAELIATAFLELPEALHDATTRQLKRNLANRLKKLPQTAKQYQKILDKKVVVVGTLENDSFLINRLSNGATAIAVYAGKKVPSNLVFERTFHRKHTQEIWLFGLEGIDEFRCEEKGSSAIKIRLIGGLDNDIYAVEDGRNIIIHDFTSNEIQPSVAKNTRVLHSNSYETNTYSYNRLKLNSFGAVPLVGFNPDDGIRIGVGFNFTQHGFVGHPFSQQHRIQSHYYFATQGYELNYSGLIKKGIREFDLVINASATSAHFVQNFFGFGNETPNDKNNSFDFNRVRMSSYTVSPGLVNILNQATTLTARAHFEAYQVENTPNRFITTNPIDSPIFDWQRFVGLGLTYEFKNYDNPFLPALGMGIRAAGKWNVNVADLSRQVPFLEATVHLVYTLTPNREWLFETSLHGKSNLNNTFEFYQAASIGGDENLRGFRDHRFSGKSAFYQSSNLRYAIGAIKNPFVPVNYGAFVGYDNGRVWWPTENSNKWHQSAGFGFWGNSSNVIASQVSYFHATDGGRFAFGITFNF